jgi:hypothetical protein
MRPNTLVPSLAGRPKHADVGVLDNLELVLLIRVKVLVEGVARQLDGLGDQAGEVDGDVAHPPHVLGEDGPEVGQHLRRRPLVRREQVVVPGSVCARERVLR